MVNAQTLARPSDYFQQEVNYRIEVALNDSNHTLSAHLELDYTNNSPDTLEFIWFHLWPNGYKNRETAFAKQQFRHGSTKFYFAKDEDRGYIDSLDFQVGAVHLEWDFHPEWIDVARVNLDQPLPPGGSVTIETPFFVKIPKIFSRLGHTGNHYEISQWYPKPAVYDRDGWHPMPYLNMGEFYSEFGSFDVQITVPREYVIMATGDLPAGDPEYAFLDSMVTVTAEYYALKTDNGKPDKKARKKWLKDANKREFAEPGEGPTKTLHFHQERVHDFAWFADKRYLVQKGALWVEDSSLAVADTARPRAITIWALYLPKYADSWEHSIEYIHDAAEWAGRIYGTYPYNHISAASSAKSGGGAMEYPNITIVSIGGNKELLEAVIMHEVVHNWHYGIFGYNERDYTWLDEGLTNYSEVPYWHNKYDGENGGRFLYVIPKGIGRLMSKPFTMRSIKHAMANIVVGTRDDVPIDGDFSVVSLLSYGLAIQSRAPVVFDFMAHYLGEDRNQALWDDFAKTWFFAHPGPADLRAAYESAAGEELSWFFDDLIGSTKRLDYGVSDLARQGSEVKVTVTNFGEIEAPVEVATLDKRGEVLSTQWLPGFSGSQTVTFSGEGVASATTDPGRYAPDFKRSNDHLPLFRVADVDFQRPALRFLLSAPEPDRTRLFYAPAIWASGYNGLTPGVVFHHGIGPPVMNRFYSALLYDFRNERP
ncbi:MAG: M1 family metallopeptidase, partial [Candidatus Marinimicrobia bacterium]|nr:M1 family metallopeptidase [Candidatus Neomarinimicrobiota bacterium]